MDSINLPPEQNNEDLTINNQNDVQETPIYLNNSDAIHFNIKAKKGRGKIPPPTPDYDITTTRELPIPTLNVDKIEEVPIVRDSGIKFTIESLGHILGCKNYEYDLMQFWILDILTDCLWKAQDIFKFTSDEQKVILNWVSTIFKTISDPLLNISRKDFLKLFKEIIFSIYTVIVKSGDFPSADIISDFTNNLMNTKVEDEESESDASTTCSISEAPSLSTLSILSNEPIKISPAFDITEYIKKLKQNNPLENAYHRQSDELVLSRSDDLEDEQLDDYNQSLDDMSFYKPDLSTPPWYHSSYTGIQGIIPSCRCKYYDDYAFYMDTEICHEEDNYYPVLINNDYPTPEISQVDVNDSESLQILQYLSNDLKCTQLRKLTEQMSKDNIFEEEDKLDEEEMEEMVERERENEVINEWAYFKLIEQRGWDMDDPRVGWVPWVSFLESQKDSTVDDFVSEETIVSEELPECDEVRMLHFKMLRAIVDFVFEYFYENFHFTLIKLAFRSTPNIITHQINERYRTPKVIKQEFKRPKPTPKPKQKKEKTPKKAKSKKEKKSKKDKSSSKSSKKSKSNKKSKKSPKAKPTKEELAEKERQRKLKEEEEAERLRNLENKVFMFPLADAASEHLFMSLFENWVKAAVKNDKKGKKGKKEKKGKKGKK